jgi:hypothetical protein
VTRTKISTALTSANVESVLRVLAGTAQELPLLAARLTEAQAVRPLEEGEWSLVEVIAHLRTSEEVSTHRIYWMLAADNPDLTLIHPHQLRKVMGYERHPIQRSLQEFLWRREDLLYVLRRLKPGDWAKTSMTGGRAHTVYSLARTVALHTEDHCGELARILAGEADP